MWKRAFRPRVLIYGVVLLAIGIAFVASLSTRAPFKADVVRDRGSLARLVEGGHIENVYRLQLMNATEETQRFRIDVEDLPGARLHDAGAIVLGPTEARWVPVAVQVTPQAARTLGAGAHPMHFRITLLAEGGADAAQAREKSTFVVPR